MIYMIYSILGFAFSPVLSWFIDFHSFLLLSTVWPHRGLLTLRAPCGPLFVLCLELSKLLVDASVTVGTWMETVGSNPKERSCRAAQGAEETWHHMPPHTGIHHL